VAGENSSYPHNDTEPLPGWLGNANHEARKRRFHRGVVSNSCIRTARYSTAAWQFQRDAHPSYVIWPFHRHLRRPLAIPASMCRRMSMPSRAPVLFIRRELFRRIEALRKGTDVLRGHGPVFPSAAQARGCFTNPQRRDSSRGKIQPFPERYRRSHTRAASQFFKT